MIDGPGGGVVTTGTISGVVAQGRIMRRRRGNARRQGGRGRTQEPVHDRPPNGDAGAAPRWPPGEARIRIRFLSNNKRRCFSGEQGVGLSNAASPRQCAPPGKARRADGPARRPSIEGGAEFRKRDDCGRTGMRVPSSVELLTAPLLFQPLFHNEYLHSFPPSPACCRP